MISPILSPLVEQLRRSATGRYDWTPASDEVTQVVDTFLQLEPDWLESVIRRDPALNRHLGLNEADRAAFLKSETSLKTLSDQHKILAETLAEITAEAKTYQGLHAIAFHRVAHALYEEYAHKKQAGDRKGAAADLLLARQISQGVRRLTAGIEIHPGATIGKRFFIDHGTGVVIGETAKIGNDVFLYHGVTLGASSGKEVAEDPGEIARRHPKIGNDATISTGVNVLGPVTIRDHVKIGTNALIKGDGSLELGEGAKVQDGVAVSKSIPTGAMVLGSVPELPGILDREQAGTPIMIDQPKRAADGSKPMPQVLGQGLEYYARGIRGLYAANDGHQFLQGHGRC